MQTTPHNRHATRQPWHLVLFSACFFMLMSITTVHAAPPTVSITHAGTQTEGEVTLTVDATDTDGSISTVRFLQRGAFVGNATRVGTTDQYSFTWTDATAGQYSIEARVIDDSNEVTRKWKRLNVEAGSPAGTAQVYYIHTDHLNTPRVIEDQNQNAVWAWDNAEAFGNNAANEDPTGTGNAFVYNHRFPGQYYDAETGNYYNYFRDYDPSTGRYLQSDPIGLRGGINTYAYAKGNPLRYTDFKGLECGRERDCYLECRHLLPSPSGDLQSSEYRKCYRECKGTLSIW